MAERTMVSNLPGYYTTLAHDRMRTERARRFDFPAVKVPLSLTDSVIWRHDESRSEMVAASLRMPVEGPRYSREPVGNRFQRSHQRDVARKDGTA